MDRIQFGTFTWPLNPEVFHMEYLREPRYVTSSGSVKFAGMSPLKRTVSGSGYFFGQDAHTDVNVLAKLSDGTPRIFSHTKFGEMNGYLTSVEFTQEPREEHISYSFVFREADEDDVIPK